MNQGEWGKGAHTIILKKYGGQGGPVVTQLTHGGIQPTLVYLAPLSWKRMKDQLGDQRGGSEWEPIKIHLKNITSIMFQNQL
jgi:hypothetical protein